ncbi:hypothetical protein FT663_02591 [Candidozyma haemuli var. vulneris]|uniref:Sas10 C-terminal domain-containing protein n=1 Tax=Candidozyma haemuli TaxID=45357 RepID=A0A2V1AXZ9_9ASCO|nr:hypothetical protein CXQ85_002692 [[Candida] haemuloni]KAF3991718.1 hypothetical protein FT663_02591 [[Candida] haemuloni var. vulneris]KAF3992085.1 hypothetical protein FT662_01394 [[Candida] haemuloni var. vulneris]PVH22967.1 hypothetical protein CXQ85_002692 [[Candida] haemuloni]
MSHDISDNELDEFDAGREKVLLDQAGDYLRQKSSDDEDSEEEVLGLRNEEVSESEDEDDNDDEDMEDQQEGSGDESDPEGWGSKKNYYGGDDDSDDNEMAEEALRQQKKHLQDLAMDDFVDEDMMEDWTKKAEEHDTQDTKHVVVADENMDLDSLDEEEKMKFLTGSYPEFVPLLKEFHSLTPDLEKFQAETKPSASIEAKLVALRAYLASISSYFALLTERLTGSQKHSSMKDEPVMESILSSREVWRQANELSSEETAVEAETNGQVASDVSEDEVEVPQQHVLTDSEEEEEESESEEEEAVEEPKPSKKAIRSASSLEPVGDYSEQSAIDAGDLLEKNRRKKSLRFYTAKINKASNKGNPDDQYAGDADLPYKERLFERQQRLMEEARKRGLGGENSMGDDLDGNDLDSGDEREVAGINDIDGEDYYESMKNARDNKKQARRSAHNEAKKAARDGKLADFAETTDENGKRALNFQILKNKGLTPNRKNDNRNARVKKRKKYDAAKKKLKSVRQVYDQNNRGPYGGEKTGIKKGMSRSVKLV